MVEQHVQDVQSLQPGAVITIRGIGPIYVIAKRSDTFLGYYSAHGNLNCEIFNWDDVDTHNGRLLKYSPADREAVELLDLIEQRGFDILNVKPKLGVVTREDIKFCSKGMMIKVAEGKFVLVDMIFSEMKQFGKDVWHAAKNLPIKRTENISAEQAIQNMLDKKTPQDTPSKTTAEEAIKKLIASRK